MLTEDQAKLFTLARAARARIQARAGAAVLDETGRTYNGATVGLPDLSLSALQVAVALAVSAGAEQLAGAVVVGGEPDDRDRRVFAALAAPGAELLLCGPDRAVLARMVAP